jgi:hypothetical protein
MQITIGPNNWLSSEEDEHKLEINANDFELILRYGKKNVSYDEQLVCFD